MKTQFTVESIGKTQFDIDGNAAIAAGYNDTSGNVCIYPSLGGNQKNDTFTKTYTNPGTDTPTITTNNATNILAFGNSPIGVPVSLPITISGKAITGNIAISSKSALFVSDTAVLNPVGTTITPTVVNVTFTPVGAVATTSFLSLTTAGGTVINVVMTGTGT